MEILIPESAIKEWQGRPKLASASLFDSDRSGNRFLSPGPKTGSYPIAWQEIGCAPEFGEWNPQDNSRTEALV